MAGNEVCLVDVVRRLDGLITEAQVGDGDTGGLLGVVLEVRLDELIGVVTDDLDGVLVGANGTVTAQTPELACDGALGSGVGSGLLLQRQAGHVIHDTDGEVGLGSVLGQILIYSEDGGRRSILRAQTVTAAHNLDIGSAYVGKSGHNVQIQRLTKRTGLLGAVQNGDLLRGGGDRLGQLLGYEGTVQANLNQTNLLALSEHIVDNFLCHVADGAHSDNYTLCVRCAVVVEQLVVGADLGIDLIHVVLNDSGERIVELVAGLTVLEEDIAVLSGAAEHGMLGIDGAGTECSDGILVHHLLQILVVPGLDLLDLVGGTEAVEEVQNGNAALDGSQMRNGTQVHNFLRIGFSHHSKTGLTAGVYVGVIAENVQGVRCNAASGYVDNARQQLTCDLIHIGDHEEQTLGCGVGGGQSTGCEGAVNGTGSTGLRLHFHNLNGVAHDVLQTAGRPGVGYVRHNGRGGNGIDGSYFGKRIRGMRRRGVAVHGKFLSCHEISVLLK